MKASCIRHFPLVSINKYSIELLDIYPW